MTYVNCPKCGHKLLEGEDGSKVQVKCNKCKSIVNVSIQSSGVSVVVSQPSNTVAIA